jgi:hypothetical protein
MGFRATTSAHGARSPGKTDWSPLAGKDVLILPDHDPEGEAYAAAVTGILLNLEPKPTVRILRLDVPNEGDDLADWLKALPASWEWRDCRAELERLAADATGEPAHPEVRVAARRSPGAEQRAAHQPLSSGTNGAGKPPLDIDAVREADGDPHRLARLFVERYTRAGQLTLYYWQDEFHAWEAGAFRPRLDSEIKAELTQCIKHEFDRIWRERIEESCEENGTESKDASGEAKEL